MPATEAEVHLSPGGFREAAKSDESTLDAILTKAKPSKDGDAKLPV
jgi:hypothetical protein